MGGWVNRVERAGGGTESWDEQGGTAERLSRRGPM